ncbi:hypothetical protein GLAREA_01623 [Glarea lozoyensis ATCC 20868]|uniref:Uncharacterized protein n=1 Tax=Glarea lozoyensis (strain ATCC 20868 / MF5171) TaxID=1116229 RepID=S3D112_GLAL2|nr:uncharacterized protein GLAREA_01623 [Glarea lozoyensis ATCC 20868]EPE25711.1 hypothetical protein GLAREA_01623 [Glarea lozoyensis ATCC 20868]
MDSRPSEPKIGSETRAYLLKRTCDESFTIDFKEYTSKEPSDPLEQSPLLMDVETAPPRREQDAKREVTCSYRALCVSFWKLHPHMHVLGLQIVGAHGLLLMLSFVQTIAPA